MYSFGYKSYRPSQHTDRDLPLYSYILSARGQMRHLATNTHPANIGL